MARPAPGSLAALWIILQIERARAPNPLVPHVGMADPHVHAFEGRVYMYATHDVLQNGPCCLGPWWVWQTDDLVTWRNVSLLQDFSWEPTSLRSSASRWATDAAERNGTYYWYVSVGGEDVAVASSGSPSGPWTDPMGRFLLSSDLGRRLRPPTNIRDPGVLKDDDGRYYIVFGACSGPFQPDDSCYYAAELNDDMLSYRTPRHLSVLGAMGPYGKGKADDKPFLHKRGNLYYLSWGCFYGIASTVYGPYQYQGSFIDPYLIAPAFRLGNATQTPWYTREDYQDRHGSFLFLHGQWYFFCNDRSHSDALVKGFWPGSFRDTVAAYVHYYDNGTIAPIVIDDKGVGSHDVAAEEVLPAENYFSIVGAEKRETSSGFEIVGLKDGSVLSYTHLRNIQRGSVPWLRASNAAACIGDVELRFGHLNGTLLGHCRIVRTGAWGNYANIPCHFESVVGTIDLLLVFRGCGGHNFARLDHIRFSNRPPLWV